MDQRTNMAVGLSFFALLMLQVPGSLQKGPPASATDIKRVYKSHISRKECLEICGRQSEPRCQNVKLFENICVLEMKTTALPLIPTEKRCMRKKVCPDGFGYPFEIRKPVGFRGSRSSCYTLLKVTADWKEAGRICKKHNSGLVSIETEEEQLHIEYMLLAQAVESDVWTSGHRQDNYDNWTWQTSDQPLGYEKWAPGEPAHSLSHIQCMHLWEEHLFKWDDTECHFEKKVLCEIDVISN